MDAPKLEAFIAVAEEESFGAAADRIRVAQSTVSARVKELEATLGQRLFSRTSRRVSLSPAGETALPKARAALAALDSLRQAVDDVAGIRRGRVRLGIVTGADLPALGETLAAFATEFPAVELLVSSAASVELEQAVADGALDIAIVVRTGRSPLRWQELLRDPLAAVGSSSTTDPVSTGTVPITDLGGHPLIVLDAGAGSRTALEATARRAGVRLTIAFQVSTPPLALDLHSRGMGVLVIPSSLVPDGGSLVIDPEGNPTTVRVGLISHPDIRTPAAELLLDRLACGLRPAFSRPSGTGSRPDAGRRR